MSSPAPMQIAFDNERDAPDIEAQPRMLVQSWRLIRTPAGTLHLVTLRDVNDEQGTVRVTSAVSAVQQGPVVVTTSSGRGYELAGPAEEREIERETLRAGAVRLGMGRAVDVSVLAWDLVDLD
jgi:hypothetical protein